MVYGFVRILNGRQYPNEFKIKIKMLQSSGDDTFKMSKIVYNTRFSTHYTKENREKMICLRADGLYVWHNKILLHNKIL